MKTSLVYPAAVQSLVANFTILLIISLILTVGISQVHRGLGAAVGIVVWAGAGIVGNAGYDMGGGVALLGLALPREGFLGLVGLLIVINIVSGMNWLRSRQRGPGPGPEHE
jgi:hypothetical protein